MLPSVTWLSGVLMQLWIAPWWSDFYTIHTFACLFCCVVIVYGIIASGILVYQSPVSLLVSYNHTLFC